MAERGRATDKRAAIEADGPQAPQRLAAVYAAEFSGLPDYRVKMAVWHALPVSALNGLRAGSRRMAAFKNHDHKDCATEMTHAAGAAPESAPQQTPQRSKIDSRKSCPRK